MSERKLLVASVFGPSDRNPHWLRLQKSLLQQNTQNYDYAVCLDKINTELFKDDTIIPSNIESSPNCSIVHCLKLNRILEYTTQNKYDSLLILDSDSLPMESWENKLNKRMGSFSVAAVVRWENMDYFPHPSVHYFKNPDIISKTKFKYSSSKNILGEATCDSTSNIKDFYPLIRTNKVNIHPIMFGVYADLFYHHGAGTRVTKEFRGMKYYNGKTNIEDEKMIFDLLTYNPKAVFNKLREDKTRELDRRSLFL